jgi:hypothetical protein
VGSSGGVSAAPGADGVAGAPTVVAAVLRSQTCGQAGNCPVHRVPQMAQVHESTPARIG